MIITGNVQGLIKNMTGRAKDILWADVKVFVVIKKEDSEIKTKSFEENNNIENKIKEKVSNKERSKNKENKEVFVAIDYSQFLPLFEPLNYKINWSSLREVKSEVDDNIKVGSGKKVKNKTLSRNSSRYSLKKGK